MTFILDLCFEILHVEIWEDSLCIFVYVKFRVFLMYVCWAAGLGKRSWEDSFRLPAFRAGCLWSLLYLSSFWQGENLMMPGNVLKRCAGTVRMQQKLGKMRISHVHESWPLWHHLLWLAKVCFFNFVSADDPPKSATCVKQKKQQWLQRLGLYQYLLVDSHVTGRGSNAVLYERSK